MQWSLRIARIAGIGIYIHFTFLLLLSWVAWEAYRQSHGNTGAALHEVAVVLMMFGIIVLHELGHAMAARRYGIRTKDITLLPIGGVARLERIPENPWQEMVVAIAGPAVNVVLAAGLFAWLKLAVREPLAWGDLWREGSSIPVRLLGVNVALILFNALPAFPMDGGRVLRAVLAMRLEYAMATQIAAAIGKGVALVFFLCGMLFPQFVILLFVAPFVWFVAGQEASMAVMRAQFSTMKVRDAMVRSFGALSPSDTLKQAAEGMFQSFQEDFPVIEGERLLGVLSKADLLKQLSRRDMTIPLREILPKSLVTLSPDDTLDTAFTRLNAGEGRLIPVVEQGSVVGVMTLDQIADYVHVNQAVLRWARGTLSPPKPPSESPVPLPPPPAEEPAGKA